MTNKHPLPLHVFKIKKRRSLLVIVENSAKGDNHLFRNLYANENGKEIDVFENGGTSCGGHVTWILLALELIKHPHAAVHGTVKDMLSSGWYETKELKPGSVIVWENKISNDGLQGEKGIVLSHMGFYVGNNSLFSKEKRESYSLIWVFMWVTMRRLAMIQKAVIFPAGTILLMALVAMALRFVK